MKNKLLVCAEHAINWYVGNYLESPNNSLRNEELFDGKEIRLTEWKTEIDELRKELAGQQMTHKQFLDLVREKGIHDKCYKYKKYESPY